MSEHIKTGEQIITSILEGKHDREEKWISLSWLTERIEKAKSDMIRCDKLTIVGTLEWILNLLSDEENKHG
jgi:hypothetical protein